MSNFLKEKEQFAAKFPKVTVKKYCVFIRIHNLQFTGLVVFKL